MADQGDASAQLNLGVMYANGQGIQEDHDQAIALYRAAAKKGIRLNLKAQYRGESVSQDFVVLAYKWFSLAASRFTEADNAMRVIASQSLDQIANKMTPAQIAEAQKLAREWKPSR